MATFKPGLVHAPVTPFKRDEQIDFGTYAKLIEFHLANGAQTLAVPMHAGESVSLNDEERMKLIEYAIKRVKGRVPVMAHASQSGTGVAADLAQRAAALGAAAVVATTPYYWTPPAHMLLEHFTLIGAAAGVPFFVYNSPEEMGGVKITADIVLKLIDRLENFAGVIDASLDWHLCQYPDHEGVRLLVRDLNRLYVSEPVLGANDFNPQGFRWISCQDADAGVLAYLRTDAAEQTFFAVVGHFSGATRTHRVGLPRAGLWREVLNSNSQFYAGNGLGNEGGRETEPVPCDGHAQSVDVTLAPFSTVIFKWTAP